MAERAFISHISEEATTAATLKKVLNKDFLRMLEVFVSSDGESIAAGDAWLESIEEALQKSSLMLVLCSPVSIRRPWINFEAGAAWMRKVPIVPLCHGGLKPGDLQAPLSFREGVLLSDERGLQRLYSRVAKVLGCDVPNVSFVKRAANFSGDLAGASPGQEQQQLDQERAVRQRLDDALRHDKFKWRSLERLAVAAGISEEVAASHLRADQRVRFAKGKSGNVIVGLRSRVD